MGISTDRSTEVEGSLPFSSEKGTIKPNVARDLNQPCIGRHTVANTQTHDITNDNVARVNGLTLSVAENRSFLGDEGLNRLYNPRRMPINQGVEGRRDDNDEKLNNIVSITFERFIWEKRHTRRIATPRLNAAGFAPPNG